MSVALVVALFAFVVLGAWWLVLQRHLKVEAAGTAGDHSPYRCVSIKAGATACAPARSAGARRFLVGEAPLLPLPDCPQRSACQCSYRHHRDRRHHNRRDAYASLRHFVLDDAFAERRQTPGRRKTDLLRHSTL